MELVLAYRPKDLEIKEQERAVLSEEGKRSSDIDAVLERFASKGVFEVEKQNESILNQIFINRGFVANEQWVDLIKIPSRVIQIENNQVICECSIDLDDDLFETRGFPIELFSNIPKLGINSPIFIKICSKPGSSRIDVLDGRGIVDMDIFELKEGWDKLKDSGLDKPFEL